VFDIGTRLRYFWFRHLKVDFSKADSLWVRPRTCTATLLVHLKKDEKKGLCEWLKCVKFPDGYASNIGRCVNKVLGKISGMKSHDCHVFLQRLLPVAIRNLSTPEIRSTLTEFSNFFIQLCARTLNVDILKQMQDDIIIILCKMEKIFPPAFFDVMIHLALHLPREAELGGPVQTRWMYPFERELRRYKKWTRNKARRRRVYCRVLPS
jgi:hypothetical protein